MKEKDIFLVLGSCRITIPLNESEHFCINTWKELENRESNSKLIIGRGWTSIEHYQMIKLILELKDPKDYCGDEYTFDKIKSNIDIIKNNFKKIKGIILEISSLKYFTDSNNRLIHNVIHKDLLENEYIENILCYEENLFYLNKIRDLVPDKKLYFVSHFMHINLTPRIVIKNSIEEFIKNDNNSKLIIPSLLWTDKTKHEYLHHDELHYKNNDIIKKIKNYLEEFLD